ncbi:MAG: hypothetical protein AAGD47_11015 [Pseudomonadota bacterium]
MTLLEDQFGANRTRPPLHPAADTDRRHGDRGTGRARFLFGARIRITMGGVGANQIRKQMQHRIEQDCDTGMTTHRFPPQIGKIETNERVFLRRRILVAIANSSLKDFRLGKVG